MARLARVVVPTYPHHVTQRGNRSQRTFFTDEDYQFYVDLLAKAKAKAEIRIWAYCLMPNHVHLVVVPERADSLSIFFREAHRQYSRRINFRMSWRGHLWQERFHSFVMDESHLIAAVRYVELNPVRARLCEHPDDWRWSSVHAHLAANDDALTSVAPMLERIENWRDYLSAKKSFFHDDVNTLRAHTRSGRPVGDTAFITHLETLTGRTLSKKKPGPRAKDK